MCMQMPVNSLRIGFGSERFPPIVVCCNPECEWEGPLGSTVVFKHDRGKQDAQHYCPECNEICELLGDEK